MGDRATCWLALWGRTTKEKAEAVYEEILHYAGENLEEIMETLEEEADFLEFQEMNNAVLPPEIHKAIQEAGLSYEWSNDAGAGFHHGVEVYDPTTGTIHHYATLDGEIALAISAANDPQKIADANAVEALRMNRTKVGYHVARSAHQEVELLIRQQSEEPTPGSA